MSLILAHFAIQITSVTCASINKQFMSFQSCFGVLHHLCQGNVEKTSSYFESLRRQHDTVLLPASSGLSGLRLRQVLWAVNLNTFEIKNNLLICQI